MQHKNIHIKIIFKKKDFKIIEILAKLKKNIIYQKIIKNLIYRNKLSIKMQKIYMVGFLWL